jgi:hypothetical protein
MGLPAAPTSERVAERGEQSRRIFEKIAEQTDVDFVSVSQDLCTPRCEVIRNGKPVYADSHHVSIFGAGEVVAPLLAERMKWP